MQPTILLTPLDGRPRPAAGSAVPPRPSCLLGTRYGSGRGRAFVSVAFPKAPGRKLLIRYSVRQFYNILDLRSIIGCIFRLFCNWTALTLASWVLSRLSGLFGPFLESFYMLLIRRLELSGDCDKILRQISSPALRWAVCKVHLHLCLSALTPTFLHSTNFYPASKLLMLWTTVLVWRLWTTTIPSPVRR